MPFQSGNVYNLVASYRALHGQVTAPGFSAVIITPENIDQKRAIIIWTDAVRYTADGIDKPNWEKALQRLMEFHPKWIVIRSQVAGVGVDLTVDERDKPDPVDTK